MKRNPSLDYLYIGLEPHINLVESYTDITHAAKVIKSCRLKPYPYVFEDKNDAVVLYKHWFDEFGNSVKILTNKMFHVIYGDTSLDMSNIVGTDLYYGLTLDKVYKFSKYAFLTYGIDEDYKQECIMIAMLGIDNYFRSYLYLYDTWKQISPLYIGLSNLYKVFDNIDNPKPISLPREMNVRIPCKEAITWLTPLPMQYELRKRINTKCRTITKALYKKRYDI